MLSNLKILQDARVLNVLQECVPTRAFSEWPDDIPPVGLLLLLMHTEEKVRDWARVQLATYKDAPMKSEEFLPMYIEALEKATKIIGLFDAQLLKVDRSSDTFKDPFPFSRDPSQLWLGYSSFLRFVPPERLRSSEMFRLDVRRIVISHLSDPGIRKLSFASVMHVSGSRTITWVLELQIL